MAVLVASHPSGSASTPKSEVENRDSVHSDSSHVSSLRSSTYRVPTDGAEGDGTLAWSDTTVVVVEVSSDGVVGTGWTYASAGCVPVIERQLTEAVMGTNVFDIPRAHLAMVRSCRNLGRPGVVSSAISAVDIALWDLKAQLLGVSLSELFGRCRDVAPLYGSGGFTTYNDERTREQLDHWVNDLGIPRVKIKVGEAYGTQVDRDLARVELARSTIGRDAELYVDANGAYNCKEAIRVGRRFATEHGVTWFEEPVSSDNLAGLGLVRQSVDMDIAAGEYGYDLAYFHRMLQAEAVDCLQIDVTRCGGYTTWLRAAAEADARGLDVSAHCAPNLHAPIALCVPNLRHVEYFHDHVRSDSLLFDGLGDVGAGGLRPDTARPGHGMNLNRSRTSDYELHLQSD